MIEPASIEEGTVGRVNPNYGSPKKGMRTCGRCWEFLNFLSQPIEKGLGQTKTGATSH